MLVARWDFNGSLVSHAGHKLLLENGAMPTFLRGGGIRFKAGSNLILPFDKLDGVCEGPDVTIVAWAKRPKPAKTLACIAGRWDEAGKRRKVALWHHVPLAGGNMSVYGHVSRWGGPTPGWKYSIDGAATRHDTTLADRVHMLGVTFDGEWARAYLDGTTDSNPDVTTRQTNPAKSITCDRNPFHYPQGLNPDSTAPFRVNAASGGGATQHARPMILERLEVYSRALTPAEMKAL
jgi:hypothetical protein